MISIVLYIAGVATGYNLQQNISEVVGEDIVQVRSDITTVEQEIPLLSLRGEGSCRILSTLSLDVNERLNFILNNLIELENRGASGEVYDDLLIDYTSLVVRGWILDRDIKDSCDYSSVPTLYFYSVPCDDCIEQGKIIDGLRDKYGDRFPVFVLNSKIDQPAVKILTRSFNITETPALIIGSKAYQGKMSRETLDNEICVALGEC